MAERCWRQLTCNRSQVNLDKLLVCGQSFRWKKNGHGEWLGVIAQLVWRLRQTDQGIQYQVYGVQSKKTGAASLDTTNKLTVQENGVSSQRCLVDFHGNDSTSEHKISSASLSSNVNHTATEHSKSFEERRARKRGIVDTIHKSLRDNSESKRLSASQKIELNRAKGKSLKKRKRDFNVKQTHPEQEDCAQNLKPEFNQHDNALSATDEDDKYSALLNDYFQLDVDVEKLYQDWSDRDPHFSKVAANFQGIRILRQDPKENLLSFICSSNNHISRIASMVEKLCCHYGDLIAEVDGEKYFSFPSFRSLSGDSVECHLRQLGFGYRAKFVSSVAKHIVNERSDGWLESLRTRPYDEAKKELLSLMGVGHKVADCVCLMSLDKPGAVPVDTHVWQITLKHYMAQLKSAKSLTDKIYNQIGDFYRELWGPYAGWAHSVLFTADLKQNKPGSLPDNEISTSTSTSRKKIKK